MKIGINCLGLIDPVAAMGIRPYVVNLLKGLSAVDQNNAYIVYVNNRSVRLMPRLGTNFRFIKVPGLCNQAGRILQEQAVLPFLALRDRVSVLHCPVQTIPLVLGSLRAVKVILTVHDVRYLFDKRNFGSRQFVYRWLMYRNSAKLADYIITISNFTKEIISKRWSLPNDKSTTVLLGVSREFRPNLRQNEWRNCLAAKYEIRRPFILCSVNSPHKNGDLLIRAFASLVSRYQIEHDLVLLGTRADLPYVKEFKRLIKSCDLQDRVVFAGYVCDEELPYFYASASLYVTLSDYEGFGLTVLEAMASGTPVIASNITALPEVVGEAGILVNQRDQEEVIRSIQSVLTDPRIRESLVRKGLERAGYLTWEKTATETLNVYKSVMGSSFKYYDNP